PTVEPADIVALDRVVCCYADMAALVSLSAARARGPYGLVYPRDTWWIRNGARVGNALAGLFRSKTRIHVHATREVEGLVRAAGLEERMRRTTTFWQVAWYDRPPCPAAARLPVPHSPPCWAAAICSARRN